MDDTLEIALAGETLRLCAGRALYWPARRRLLVADVHLGKDDVFRAAGIALPSGGTRDDLARLTALIDRHGAQSLWVLGDLLHGPRTDARWRDDWARFRDRHAGMDMRLIEGNHDRVAARVGLGIDLWRDDVVDGPLSFGHAPRPAPSDGGPAKHLHICGHVHPVVRVPGFRGRFPAFALVDGQLILPAFSLFTGGWLVRQAQARYACMGTHLLALD